MNISVLDGVVSQNEDGDAVIVMVGGVGYRVVMSKKDREASHLVPHTKIEVRTIVKEDSITLYGFRDRGARPLFDALLKVDGVGPRIALTLLEQLGAESLMNAFISKDASRLRVPGCGPKTAQKIIDEVKL